MAVNKIFSTLSETQIDTASGKAEETMKDFVGQPLNVVAASMIMLLEFVTRHTHYSMQDIADEVEFLADYNESRGDVGSVSTAVVQTGEMN